MKAAVRHDWLMPMVIMILVFIMAARTPVDTDLWWHLRAGEETVSSGYPLLSDHYSYSRSGFGWINHSWLAQVGLYGLYQLGGFLAIGLSMALGATISMALVYAQSSGPGWLRGIVIILASVVASVVWTPRPQMITLILLAATGYVLYLKKWHGVDRLWLLPVIFMLWGNLHGGYVLGILLVGAFGAGEILNHFLRIQRPEVMDWNQIRNLSGWGSLSILVLLVNPNGLETWLIPFRTVEVRALQQTIEEWASPNFHEAIQQPFLLLLFASFAAMALSNRRADGVDITTLVLFGTLGLVARRNFGPFALVAAPILCRYAWWSAQAWLNLPQFEEAEQSLRIAEPPTYRRPRWQRRINLMLVAILALVGLVKLYVVTQPVVVDGIVRSQYPVKAIEWLNTVHPEGRLLSEYGWGGYLQWILRDYPVFVDGRTDLFGDEIIGQWMTVVQAGNGWENVLSRWDVSLVMIDPQRPVVNELVRAGWKQVYLDSQAVILQR